MPSAERVAIVGMAARLPGSGDDLESFWQNVSRGVDCSRDVPEGRWLLTPEECFDARIPYPDSVYSTRGYFLDPFTINADDYGIPEDLLTALDPLFHLALDVGFRAWQNANTLNVDLRRAGVILGNICLPTEKSSDLARDYLGARITRALDLPTDNKRTHPLNRYVAGLPAGILAKALGFGGGSFTLDAACASSLYAMKLACDELLSERADVMLAGGMSRPDCLYTQMGFSQLRALSTSGRCSPFDATADGLVVGEGAGIFVLKRLSDAIRAQDHIYGVIAGIGLSNDMHGNLLAPAKEGQLRAMNAAYTMAGWKPHFADLIECHATGTPVGDAVEFESLRELWGTEGWKAGQCVIGSVKSTVGHLLTGAGAAALTKVLMAMRNRVRPQQANFTSPNPSLKYVGGPLRVPLQNEVWDPRRPTLPRRAAISGFGFGGVNGHLLVEEYVGQSYSTNIGASQFLRSKPTPTTPVAQSRLMSKLQQLMSRHPDAQVTTNATEASEDPNTPIAIIGMGAHFGPWDQLRGFQERALGGGAIHPARVKTTGRLTIDPPTAPGYYIENLVAPLDRFRIPPKEIEEMLPQQLLMLTVAAAALDDCKGSTIPSDQDDPRSGVFVGLGLDLNTTNFHLRWAAKQHTTHLRPPLKRDRSVPIPTDWTDTVVDSVSPPLNANRTMGALGSIAASRIARTFHFGGPSFTLCSEESSSGRAIELAVRALRQRELDRAVVGGVDLAGDLRSQMATDAQRPFSSSGQSGPLEITSEGMLATEGAGAVVLKRLADAERDGDRIYAIIRGVGVASGGSTSQTGPDSATYASSMMRALTESGVDPATVEYFEVAATGSALDDRAEADALGALLKAKPRTVPLTLSSVRSTVGHPGAAGPIASLIKSATALYQQILPPGIPTKSIRPELAGVKDRFPATTEPRFWLKDSGTTRRALVAATGVDGTSVHVVLEESGQPIDPVVHIDPSSDPERLQPLGARSEAIFAIEADSASDMISRLADFRDWVGTWKPATVEFYAREWLLKSPFGNSRRRAIAFVSRSKEEVLEQVSFAMNSLRARPDGALPAADVPETRTAIKDRIFYTPQPLTLIPGVSAKGRVAFVFPGSGNHFPGMGRDLGVQWPEILRRQESENQRLRSQYTPDLFWSDDIPASATPREFLFGQVTLGTLTADLLISLGVKPEAMIGMSLGESAGLFGLRVWRERDEMLRRIETSTLFQTDLAPPYNAARAFWNISEWDELDWASGVLAVSADDLEPYLKGDKKVFLLITTTPNECVIGGVKEDVLDLAAKFPNKAFLPLSGVTLAHCEAGRPVEAEYKELHTLTTTPPTGLTIYSGAYGRQYKPTSAIAADSITAGLLNTIDFPACIQAAYRDGVRVFIEVGPGNSTSRMISATLAGKPHLTRVVCVQKQDGLSLVLRTLAALIAERVPVDLTRLYGGTSVVAGHQLPSKNLTRSITVPVGMTCQAPPAAPWLTPPPAIKTSEPLVELVAVAPSPPPEDLTFELPSELPEGLMHTSAEIHLDTQAVDANTPTPTTPSELAAVSEPKAFRAYATATATAPTAPTATQSRIVSRLLGFWDDDLPASPPSVVVPTPYEQDLINPEPPRSLNMAQCFEFARGKIGTVLGPLFANIDSYPTRVRLPDGPLMLVDNIRLIEGEPLSMMAGRVVTDHTVDDERWYLDAGRCPTSITVESGQADLFLAGFLGIDQQTRGEAVYRLLDAVVTFHRGLPKIGETIVYDIHIDQFFRQADSWLFRFRFEGTVNGEPLLSMQNGVAGFFTQAALAAGQGIVQTKLDKQAIPGKTTADWRPLAPMQACKLTKAEVQALHVGDYVSAFGSGFVSLPIRDPVKLPTGMLRLLDRIPLIDPTGGRFGLGFIRGEYDIQPHEWFIECHFVDDKVMPGTLMYECCLHTLRVLVMRFGWVGEAAEIAFEPVPGIKSRLKCRGQVLDTTNTVTYEVSIKEIGYRPEAYCIADALMYADGKPIVEITNLSMRLEGLTLARLEKIWAKPDAVIATPPIARPQIAYEVKPAIYDRAKILAYSNGNPSEGFGEPYKVFDRDRILARLPGPPFQFVDRITAVTGEPFVLKPGAGCEAQYDIPPDAWYFEANRGTLMPFSVLLETALQPCGWLAAYCGSALTSEQDLSFRNLGGGATQYLAITPDMGTLTTNVTMTKVSNSGGMIIQHYDMLVTNRGRKVYEGNTYFGFFAKEALKNQVGMPNARLPAFTSEQLSDPNLIWGRLPTEPPFPAPMMRMVDQIDGYHPEGGRRKLGLIHGRITVDPSFWFFTAHFYQDPVWPGSLGLESFLQLAKFLAFQRFGHPPDSGWQTVALNQKHDWVYRGQVVPGDHEVKVLLEVTEVDEANRRLTFEGFLTIDGRIIYQMNRFTLE
ncbi:MAG: beta-ketoacyl synthase N-terminal-like domain-containing protein [Fimbriiglobus sp.]